MKEDKRKGEIIIIGRYIKLINKYANYVK